MNRAFIFVGTNIDRKKNYLEALRRLSALGHVACVSSVYETAPLGSRVGGDYYNGAVLLETELDSHELKRRLREIESAMGRVRSPDRNTPRTIDLDLVLFNDAKIDEGAMLLPDPLILERPFMLITLAELDPEYVHPVAKKTLAELASGLEAKGMRLDPAMTAEAQKLAANLYTGEISHA